MTPEQVRAQFGGLFGQAVTEIAAQQFEPSLEVVAGSHGLHSSRERYSQALLILVGIMALVLLIACANVAKTCCSTRSAARQREIATRLSVGATRGRVIRQLLTESLLLAVAGGTLGALFAYWGKDLLLRWGPWSVQPEQVLVHVDWRVLGFAAGVSVATGLLFGIAPAVRAVRAGNEAVVMKQGGATGRGAKFGKTLAIGQLAMSLVLLVTAGLFAQTLWNLRHIDLGFDPSNLLTFRIDPALNRYEPERFLANVEQIIERLAQVDGLRAVHDLGAAPRRCRRQLRQPPRSVGDRRGVAGFDPLELFRDGRCPDRVGPKLYGPRRPEQSKGRHRQRGVRAAILPGWRVRGRHGKSGTSRSSAS